jgi:ASC-1-like (ASCH) protein
LHGPSNMKRHELRLHPAPFEKIKAGSKTIEMRLWDEKRQQMRVGDNLVFYKRPEEVETLTCTIVALHRFASFKAMCEALPVERMGYEGASLAAWQTHGDPGMAAFYSAQDEARYGVVGIEVEKLSS